MNNVLYTPWGKVLKEMQSEVTAVSYDLYIKTLEPIKYENGKLIFLATTENNKNQLLKLHINKLRNACEKFFGPIEELVILEPNEGKELLEEVREAEEELRIKHEFDEKNKLNEKYTFDTFVVGTSNQVVYYACKNVAKNPGKNFNPLLIYGGVGLGKTHLLHAIGNYIRKNFPKTKLLYVTCEQFMNDFTRAIREKTNEAFRKKYREIDVLMVDDIQFIANKTGTQEEFFHTFNDLYQHNKQIVLASDKHPRNMETLEERLKSRFAGGLIHDIQKPDYETRLAILEKKVMLEDYKVEGEVLEYLAEKIDTNIRELEGSLNKVVSLAMLMGKPQATMFEAEEALKDIEFDRTQHLTVDRIIDLVCKYYNVKRSDLIGKKKNKEIVDPRQVCMYVATELLDVPLMTIGESMGGRDHTTVMHARDKIAENIRKDKALKTEIDDLITMLKSES